MRTTLLALGLAMASGAAVANTGSISFHGHVDAGTCPIQIIDPQTGLPVSRIFMGNINAAQVRQVDEELASRTFGMRLTPGNGCTLIPGAVASVTFTGAYGGAGANGALYALQPGGSIGLALVIKDDAGTQVVNGTPSRPYALHDSLPTSMLFSVAYRSIAAKVTPGHANTDLRFLVDIQ